MGLNKLSNCPKCGKLFIKAIRDVCTDCYKLEEEEYKIVSTYLKDRENRQATIYEVSEATNVSVKQITKFIRQGRISMVDLPNMGFPCESCGQLTRESNLCTSCRHNLNSQVEQLVEQEERRMEEEKYKIKDVGYRQIKK